MRLFTVITIAAIVFISCGSGNQEKNSNSSKKANISLTAAGATFPLPFYNLSIKNYSTQTGVSINYGGVGSGGGITSLKDRVVDFGATDAFLSQEQEAEMPASIVHIPTCIGAVVIAYNLEGVEGLKLSNKNLEEIFLGNITMWNDDRIMATNPGLPLPEMAVTVVERSDGSGTTYIFSDFMSKISKEWETKVGRGKSLNWPVGIGAKGNPGVAGTIKETPGSIGYVGSEFAFAQKIQFAEVENSAGKYIRPSLESISAAARGEIPANTKIMLTCSSDPEAYPISGFTWIILYGEQNYNKRTLAEAEETVKFLAWLVEKDAQALAQQVHYAPLPAKTVEQAKTILGSVTYDGKPLLNN
ncbi:MAG: phosphate ABC transporter substrate-binding protein PstS [Bacteroidia bacterium]|nr:MAG: phosphate ABC transporter substrate-binding protein PstS [Bacteroidia bacterium]